MVAGALALAACDKAEVAEAKAAEQRYAMAKAGGPTKEEECAAAREVEQAWLQALDRDKYRDWELRADISCRSAEIERLLAR